ncbi:PREDICTED: protein YIPF2 [Nanorana parkeri]|uniref:protein YIPF2 n=1 Tax=Nanorana parkeri TaxID=125878 RepID=UPI0008549C85|nr:PREDICTED: protein YIPF2 [Nanorana parkeri]
MAAPDQLQFQEFEEAAVLLSENPNATTKSASVEAAPQHATLHMGGDSEGEEGETDSSCFPFSRQLLSPQKKPSGFWTLQYYQDLFDVDTCQVLDRIRASFIPVPGKNFVRHHLRNNPDLYGPFWICATLVITVTVVGNLATFIQMHGTPGYNYSPQFHKVTVAGLAIYSYAWLVPLALWGFLQWRKGVSPMVGTYSFMETVCVYGYSLSAYIPSTLLCVVPYEIFRWIILLLAMCLSALVLVLAFWPHIRRDNKMVAIGMVTSMVLLHVLLAVGCKAYFFRRVEEHHPEGPMTASTTTKALTTSHPK